MTIKEVQKVCFVGAGTMGCFNSLVSAIAGYDVVLYDVSEEALQKVPERHQQWAEVLIEKEAATRESVAAAISRVKCTTDPEEAARDADYLSESVLERLQLKREVHRQFDKLLPPHAIMTTNTSSLLVSDIEDAVGRGDRFAAMHFHQPSTVVDIVAGPRTSAETIDIVKRFVKSQGQVYIYLKKERAGYLHNAMYGAILGASVMLAAITEADYKEIDRAWMLNQNSLAGPFGMMDHVGLNVMVDASVTDEERDEQDQARVDAVQGFFNPYIERGDLGMKTGKGFYTYPEPEFSRPEFISGHEENKEYSDAILSSFFSTALMLVIGEFATLEEVDRCWMLIHQCEFGPFGLMDRKGLDTVLTDLDDRIKLIEAMLGEAGEAGEEQKLISEYLRGYIERGELGEKSSKGFYTHPNPEFKRPDFLIIPDS
ncbi:MAG: hypothetical protein GY866_00935 [Proteobacteria bacterium]|nr:hypothetical protein [Pseudomonadota bacterium]